MRTALHDTGGAAGDVALASDQLARPRPALVKRSARFQVRVITSTFGPADIKLFATPPHVARISPGSARQFASTMEAARAVDFVPADDEKNAAWAHTPSRASTSDPADR